MRKPRVNIKTDLNSYKHTFRQINDLKIHLKKYIMLWNAVKCVYLLNEYFILKYIIILFIVIWVWYLYASY